MEIITGYTGENHVTSADDASLYRGILGQDDYVLEVGSKFAATIIDNNTVRVMDGDLLIQGHQARIRANDYNEVTIDNGTPGQKRNDLIVARYQKNTTTGVESIALEVVKGTPGAIAIDPEIIQEDLKTGGTQRDYPLYRVALDGISLANLTTLFRVIPNFSSHMADNMQQKTVHGLKIADFVVDHGVNYTKWNSGKLECWGVNNPTTDENGLARINLPIPVSERTYSISVLPGWSQTNNVTLLRGTKEFTYFTVTVRNYAALDNIVNATQSIDWRIIGRWK